MTTRIEIEERESEIYRLIIDSEDMGMSCGQLAYLLSITPAQVLRVLRKLEAMEWITRSDPPIGAGVRWFV